MSKALPTRAHDYATWYNTLVKKAGLAENSPVRGCMTIKPYGFAVWEKIQQILDQAFKATGHLNAYFPLFIPKSYLSREAEHVEGFAKECAVVTHYRLKTDANGQGVVVDPDAKLEEELIVRPTSETIIWDTYKNWIQSYRDLPLLINQWANVVRWEMRTRLFLRTAEFLWQEGHTAHATEAEAREEAARMLNLYVHFIETYMAIPVLKGEKPAHEKFAGAVTTYTIETLTQDGKALQAGTSHFLGQNFAKAFDVKFSTDQGTLEYVWGTSWGMTTRLVGALIMAHSDDQGLVLPPKLAPVQVVIVPIYKGEAEREAVVAKAQQVRDILQAVQISVQLDDRDSYTPGWKFSEYELKGVPVRIAIGPKDLQRETVEVARRDTLQKNQLPIEGIGEAVSNLLEDIQQSLFDRASQFRQANTTEVDTYDQFKEVLATKRGYILAHWDGTTETANKIKEETKATIRCIPLDMPERPGQCIYTGNPSTKRVVFAESY